MAPDQTNLPLLEALLTDDQHKALDAYSRWQEDTELDSIAGETLSAVQCVYQRWPSTLVLESDPRIAGAVRQAFYRNQLIKKAIDAINTHFHSISADRWCWIRAGALAQYASLFQKSPMHNLDILAEFDTVPVLLEELQRQGWTCASADKRSLWLSGPEQLPLRITTLISPHWDDHLHREFIVAMQSRNSALWAALEQVNEIAVTRAWKNAIRLYRFKLYDQLTYELGETDDFAALCKRFGLTSALSRICDIFEAFDSHLHINRLKPLAEEVSMLRAYEEFIHDRSKPKQLRYHFYRYKQLGNSGKQTSFVAYLFDTFRDRRRNLTRHAGNC